MKIQWGTTPRYNLEMNLIKRKLIIFTCKHITSQTAEDPKLPSSPSLTNCGIRTLKYTPHTLSFIFIDSAIGCNTYSHITQKFSEEEAISTILTNT